MPVRDQGQWNEAHPAGGRDKSVYTKATSSERHDVDSDRVGKSSGDCICGPRKKVQIIFDNPNPLGCPKHRTKKMYCRLHHVGFYGDCDQCSGRELRRLLLINNRRLSALVGHINPAAFAVQAVVESVQDDDDDEQDD